VAIAYVNSADLGNNSGSGSLTASYTVGSGANRLLVVVFLGDASNGNDDITAVTYAGVSLTLAAKIPAGSFTTTQQRLQYIYFLLNPASGANNVFISSTNNHYLVAGCADYSGVAQSGQPDKTTTLVSASTTTITTTLTTVANNCWTVLMTQQFPNDPTAGAGSTVRVSGAAFSDWTILDSNGPITPAGSTSMTANFTSAIFEICGVMVSFSPAASGTAVQIDYGIPMEMLGSLRRDFLIPSQSLGAALRTLLLPNEWRDSLHSDLAIPIKMRASERSDLTVPIGYIGTPRNDWSIPIEYVGPSRIDWTIALESLGNARSDALLPISYVGDARADATIRMETLGDGRSDATLPAEHLGGVFGNAIVPVEWAGTGTLISIDWLQPISWAARASEDRVIPAAWSGHGAATFNVPITWAQASVTAVDIDWLQPMTWGARVAADWLIPISLGFGALQPSRFGQILPDVRAVSLPVDIRAVSLPIDE
jgi:hypothetical protein